MNKSPYLIVLCCFVFECFVFAQKTTDSIPYYQFLPRKLQLLESYKVKLQDELVQKSKEQKEISSMEPTKNSEYLPSSGITNNIVTSETKVVPHTQNLIPYSSISSGPVFESWKAIYTIGFDSVEDKAISITCDNKGYIYVTGSSETENDIDFLTIKYDTSGVEQWTARYDGPGNSIDQAVKVVVDKSGNVYVAGSSVGNGTDADFVLVKYDSTGIEQWVIRYNGMSNLADYCYAMTIDTTGNIYLTGGSFNDGTNFDYITIKYNSEGNQEWIQQFNGSGNGADYAYAIDLDDSGNVYITGSTGTIKYGNDGTQKWAHEGFGACAIKVDSFGNAFVTGTSDENIVTKKYNYIGEIWSSTYDGGINEWAVGLDIDDFGNVYVIGNPCFIIIKYDSQGSQQWSLTPIPCSFSYYYYHGCASSFIIDNENNLIITGTQGGITEWTYEPYDYYLTVKVNTNGEVLFSRTITWSEQAMAGNMALDITCDNLNNIYLSGKQFSYGNRCRRCGANYNYGTVKYDNSGNIIWTIEYEGETLKKNFPIEMKLDRYGDTYITGISKNPQEYNILIAGIPPGRDYNLPDWDFLTVKLNSEGTYNWYKTYSSDVTDYYVIIDKPNDLIINRNNEIIITGTIADRTPLYCRGGYFQNSALTIKYDINGDVKWMAKYDYWPNNDSPCAVTCDMTGNVYITGFTDWNYITLNSGDWAPIAGFFTVKYDTNGVEKWSIIHDCNGKPTSICVDSSGNVYVAGYTTGIESAFDFTLIKYDSLGNELWVSKYNGTGNNEDILVSMVLDDSGNVYVTGSSVGVGSSHDFVTIKYNTDGIQQWVTRYNGPGNGSDYPTAMVMDDSGYIYITGYCQSISNDHNYTTIKYDRNGVGQWIVSYNGTGNGDDKSTAIAIDSMSNIYVTGSSVGLDSVPDYMTVKYDNRGRMIWSIRSKGFLNSIDNPIGIGIDGENNVVISGGSENIKGSSYYVTLKYSQNSSIEGQIFNDINCNGFKDSGEVGLPGRIIQLSGDESLTTTTDTAGRYMFTNLKIGEYIINEIPEPGWVITVPSTPIFYTVEIQMDGSVLNGYDFGNYLINPLPHEYLPDSNTVLLLHMNEIEGNRVYDASGNQNHGVASGTIIVDGKYGKARSIPDTGDGIVINKNLLGSINNNFTLEAWIYPTIYGDVNYRRPIWSQRNSSNPIPDIEITLGSLWGGQPDKISIVFRDDGGNLSQYIGHSTIPLNVWTHVAVVWNYDLSKIQLYLNGILDIEVTLATYGSQTGFDYFMIGKNWIDTQTDWFGGTIDEVRVSNIARNPDEFFVYSHISGMKFNDINSNGIFDSPDTGIANWKILLSGKKIDSTYTDVNGLFTFTELDSGLYTIREEQQAGWVQTFPELVTHTVDLGLNDSVFNVNFGNFQLATISGKMFKDINRNGIKDEGEPGLFNWKIRLSGTQNDSTFTDENGDYTFTGLQIGTYMIEEELKSGWEQTYPSDPAVHTVVINSSGQNVLNLDFGNAILISKIKLALSFKNANGSSVKNLYWGIRSGAALGIWGIDPDATDVDSSEGENELPPPMSGAFDVRFVNPDHIPNYFNYGSWVDIRNFRSSTQIDTFKVSFQPGPIGYPVVFKWSKEAIIQSFNGDVRIGKNPGNWIDMKTVDSIEITNVNTSTLYIISKYPSLPILYHEGWNIVSIPMIVSDPRKTKLFPTAISQAYRYDSNEGYQYSDSLKIGIGYWLKFSTVVSPFILEGEEVHTNEIDVFTGWNLIGTISGDVPVNTIQSDPQGIIQSNFFDYKNGYQLADTLKPFIGYWVKVKQDGQLILSSPIK